MTIEIFNKHLKTLLLIHKHKPYVRDNEGLVYIGVPEASTIIDKKDKYEFIYLLCMFIALDLKTFEINNQFYLTLKKEFYIPKFEYGLSNTFVYPNRIFDVNKIGIIDEYFSNSFSTFYTFSKSLTKNIDDNFDLDILLDSITEDKDLKLGIFGANFVNKIFTK